jgi:hypothetical protein
MSMLVFKKYEAFGYLMLSLGLSLAPSLSAQEANLTTEKSVNGMTTHTAKADQVFPMLKGFLSIPSAQRDQISLGYTLKVKNAPASQIKIQLIDQGQTSPISIDKDGVISPLPSLTQLKRGAEIHLTGPQKASASLKLKIYSTQGLKTTYDAQGLSRGITQGNSASKKLAGVLAAALPKLDRVYFIGATNGRLSLSNGNTMALPMTTKAGEYPAGTPYFVGSQYQGAVTINFTKSPNSVMYDTPPKK